MHEAVNTQGENMIFLLREHKDKSVDYEVVERIDEELTDKQAIARLRKIRIPVRAHDGSKLTLIYLNGGKYYHLHAVLKDGKWKKESLECIG